MGQAPVFLTPGDHLSPAHAEVMSYDDVVGYIPSSQNSNKPISQLTAEPTRRYSTPPMIIPQQHHAKHYTQARFGNESRKMSKRKKGRRHVKPSQGSFGMIEPYDDDEAGRKSNLN